MGRDKDSDRTHGFGTPQADRKHPEEWQGDLNPGHMAGQNLGVPSTDRETGLRTAYDAKELHRSMSELNDEELKRIPVIAEGERLQQGSTYLDLRDPERGEFTAMGGMVAGGENAYVPKDRVPYPTWNRLRGVDDPERAP